MDKHDENNGKLSKRVMAMTPMEKTETRIRLRELLEIEDKDKPSFGDIIVRLIQKIRSHKNYTPAIEEKIAEVVNNEKLGEIEKVRDLIQIYDSL